MEQPHRGVLWFKGRVYPKLDTGELSGNFASSHEIGYVCDGELDFCEGQLKEIMKEIQGVLSKYKKTGANNVKCENAG